MGASNWRENLVDWAAPRPAVVLQKKGRLDKPSNAKNGKPGYNNSIAEKECRKKDKREGKRGAGYGNIYL